MTSPYPVIIVGSGVGGVAAAELLAAHGLGVLMVDDNAHPGGQLLRQPPRPGRHAKRLGLDRLKGWGARTCATLKQGPVTFLQGTQVLGIYPQQTLLVESRRGAVAQYRAEALILATGARERQVPFPGWTLPGVICTGGAQILMKGSGILPGATPLIAGSSPLMLALAAEILANGGRVMAVLDEGRSAQKLRGFGAGVAILPKLLEGALYLARLLAARVPLRQRVRVVEARGKTGLDAVVVAQVDARGQIRQGTERIYPTDTLAMGHGFVPNIELAGQAGCRTGYAVDKGGWHVVVDDGMETSVAGVYAVGETTGIAGGEKSRIEGRLAAWRILKARGRVDAQTYAARVGPLLQRRRQQVRYGAFINRLCRPPGDLYAQISDDTIVCRCEEITLGEIRRQIGQGFTTLNGIKRTSRCGMGHCQGRTCAPILFDLLCETDRHCPAAIGPTSWRAPVKAVSLGALARMKTLDGDTPTLKRDF
jgi:NADPH-dependent 2,4-dienoyl-CoA reductase/sulfur reductase-like enzyme